MSQYITIGIVTVNPLRREAACLYKIFTFFALYSSKYNKDYTQLKLNRPDVLSRYKSEKFVTLFKIAITTSLNLMQVLTYFV